MLFSRLFETLVTDYRDYTYFHSSFVYVSKTTRVAHRFKVARLERNSCSVYSELPLKKSLNKTEVYVSFEYRSFVAHLAVFVSQVEFVIAFAGGNEKTRKLIEITTVVL